jgi:hypothetical protein
MGSGRKGSSQRIAPATSITEAGRRDARLFAPAFEADWVLVVVFAVLSTPGRGGMFAREPLHKRLAIRFPTHTCISAASNISREI